ncbi:MAG: DUF3108 domain-containing protein [Hydrogenophaga sp.]|nr:DUF3108 domain-containing protein [Hydrogenophaga sp.]
MNTLARVMPTDRVAPRWRVLLGLGALVLLVHIGLLSGGFSGLSMSLFTSPDAGAPQAPSPTTRQLAEQTAQAELEPDLPPPATSSRIRWIQPKPPEPAPAPPPPPPPVEKKPEPVVVPEPEPILPPEPAAEVVVEPPAPAVIDTPPPEPALVADTEPAPVVDDLAVVAPPVNAQGDAAVGTVEDTGAGVAEASLPPATPPPSATLQFAATALSKKSTYQGSGQLEWRAEGQQYEAHLAVRVLVFTVLEQSSKGHLAETGLQPDRFSDRRRSSERATHFDRDGQRLRYSNNAPDGKLLPGTQDRLSINFQLAGLFNARPDAYPDGQVLRVPVTSTDASELWLFQVGPQVTTKLPAGEVQARKLTRNPRKEYDRKVEVWLLPEYAHLPGRIRITEPNGDYLDMQLETLPVINTGSNIS